MLFCCRANSISGILDMLLHEQRMRTCLQFSSAPMATCRHYPPTQTLLWRACCTSNSLNKTCMYKSNSIAHVQIVHFPCEITMMHRLCMCQCCSVLHKPYSHARLSCYALLKLSAHTHTNSCPRYQKSKIAPATQIVICATRIVCKWMTRAARIVRAMDLACAAWIVRTVNKLSLCCKLTDGCGCFATVCSFFIRARRDLSNWTLT